MHKLSSARTLRHKALLSMVQIASASVCSITDQRSPQARPTPAKLVLQASERVWLVRLLLSNIISCSLFVSSTPPQSFIGFLVFLVVVLFYPSASSLLPNLPPSPSRKVSVVLFPPHNSTHLLHTCSEVVEGEGEGEGRGEKGKGRGGGGREQEEQRGKKV